jgi:hypothetical protein
MSTPDPDHPRHKLAFFVVEDVDDTIRAKVRDFVTSLGTSQDWLLGPPVFVDVLDEPEDDSHGDLPVEDVGGYIEMYSVRPPWTLPREVELQHLLEAKALLTALEEFARKSDLNFEVEFAGELIGAVTHGSMDAGLREGLLDEWHRHLGLSS